MRVIGYLSLLLLFAITLTDEKMSADDDVTPWFHPKAEQLNVSAYDAGYIAVAKAREVELFSRDAVVVKRAPKVGVTVRP